MVWTTPAVIALAGVTQVASLSFQQTPVMGWNSYNQMSCSPTSEKITTTINTLASRGFVDAGYKFFQIDCGWASRDGQRNATNGALKVDLKAFPNGLKPLSDLARSKGMKWTMYSDAGVRMCDPQSPSPVLGSLGHEAADAEFFKTLGTEYVKCMFSNILATTVSSSHYFR
jgi:alpha-galactosidase